MNSEQSSVAMLSRVPVDSSGRRARMTSSCAYLPVVQIIAGSQARVVGRVKAVAVGLLVGKKTRNVVGR